MKVLLVGYGEIGRAFSEILDDLTVYDPAVFPFDRIPEGYFDILLVAIPWSNTFIETVKGYQEKYNIKSTIIFSTVPVGTSKECNAVHSPVEGKHPHLAESIKIGTRWVGGEDELAIRYLSRYFENTHIVAKPEFTEFLKLSSTTKYGINIVFAEYVSKVCQQLEMPYQQIVEWDKDYNELYSTLGNANYQKYILTPPNGHLGGHCVVPNAEILCDQFPSIFTFIVANFNKMKGGML